MSKKSTLLLLTILLNLVLKSQKQFEILERGIIIPSNENLYLKFTPTDNSFKLQTASSMISQNFKTFKDSLIYLVEDNSINIYLLPYNPLTFSHTHTSLVIEDPINEEINTSLNSLFLSLSEFSGGAKGFASDPKKKLKALTNQLNNNQNSKINSLFNQLKALSFSDQKKTEDDISKIYAQILEVNSHFDSIKFEEIEKEIKIQDTDSNSVFNTKFIYSLILNDLKELKERQLIRVKFLMKMYSIVDTYVKKILDENIGWVILVNNLDVNEGKINIISVKIDSSGYQMNTDKDIVAIPNKEIIKRTLRFKKYNRWIIEVLPGTAFTFFRYPNYGTGLNDKGELVVKATGDKVVNKLNFNLMFNFNHFKYNSNVHFLFQFGVGLNPSSPTLFAGSGFRFNNKKGNANKRIAISFGIAITGAMDLDKLELGDKVTGTADIENDLKYQFISPKPYLGIQFGF